MRKIITTTFVTLDGVMQAPGGSKEDAAEGFKYGGWMANYRDDVMGKVIDGFMKIPFEMLLGKKTYDIFAATGRIRIRPQTSRSPTMQRKSMSSRTLRLNFHGITQFSSRAMLFLKSKNSKL